MFWYGIGYARQRDYFLSRDKLSEKMLKIESKKIDFFDGMIKI